jgi:hypothetical protein
LRVLLANAAGDHRGITPGTAHRLVPMTSKGDLLTNGWRITAFIPASWKSDPSKWKGEGKPW